MPDNTCPRAMPAAAEGKAATIWYLAAVCLLPGIVLWHQNNILFTGSGYLDPWVSLGYFRNLMEFKRSLLPGNTYGEYFPWILPGAALHKLFAPLTANCLLHLGVHTLGSVSLFLTLKWVVGARRAFVAAMLFSLNPWFTFAAGWDYTDGIGAAYCLLTMALLTWAAIEPARRWALVAAGLALAALVYSNAEWIALAPLPPIYYLGLMRAWHGTPLRRSFLGLCRWFGPGCLFVTVAFTVLNYWMEGRIAFYAGPVLEWFHGHGPAAPWWQGLWRDGAPSLWLAFAIAAAAASAAVLVGEGRRALRAMTGAALFSWLFLAALAWTIGRQILGSPVLGTPQRASILLPFSFLAIGGRFWPELETACRRNYLIFCGAAAVLLGYAWLDEGATSASSLPYPVWMGMAALAASLLLRLAPERAIYGMAGFFILTALGMAPCYGGVAAHRYLDQYAALCQARDRIETVRQRRPVRFWYDQKDRTAGDAVALATTYFWDATLSQSFGAPPCGQELAPSTIVAVVGPDESHGAEFVAAALTACWSGRGLRLLPVETDVIQHGASSYYLSLVRVDGAAVTR